MMVASEKINQLITLMSRKLKGHVVLTEAEAAQVRQTLEALAQDIGDAQRECAANTQCVEPRCMDCPYMVLESTVSFLEGLK